MDANDPASGNLSSNDDLKLMKEAVHCTARPAGRPRPAAPTPLEKPPGAFKFLRAMRNGPIEGLTRAHFEQPIVTTATVLGPVMVVSAPAALKHVLIDNAANYRRERLQREILATGLGIGLLSAENDQWRRQRRVAGSFFTPKLIANLAEPMAAAAASLVETWARLPEHSLIDVAAQLQWATIDVLERTVFRDGIGDNRSRFPKALMHYLDTVGRLDPLDAFNAPWWVPRIGRLRARRSIALFNRTAESLVDNRRRRLAEAPASVPEDFLTLLLQARDPKSDRGLSLQEVKDNIVTFIAASFETGANVLAWALYLLAIDDEWRERIQSEADHELPDGRYVDGSLERLVVTRAVIEETMRLYPPVPVTARQTIGPDQLEQQEVAAGTVVIIAPWVLHRHRLLWDEPDLFDPSRFLPGARESIGRFAYLPFGAGPRTCIGAAYAMQEVIIMLAAIVRRFRLELAPGHRVWPVHRVTLHPQGGLPMILNRRQ
jgi:cytochrome P450